MERTTTTVTRTRPPGKRDDDPWTATDPRALLHAYQRLIERIYVDDAERADLAERFLRLVSAQRSPLARDALLAQGHQFFLYRLGEAAQQVEDLMLERMADG